MFVLCLVLALIAGAVLLALNAHERVEGLVLVDKATGAIVLEGWAILAQHAVITGILATVVFLLALAIGLSASELHIRLALHRRREWLDRKHGDRQLGIGRDDCLRLEKQLADTERRLVAARRRRAEFRRSLRRATRERDRALRADAPRSTAAENAAPRPEPPGRNIAAKRAPHVCRVRANPQNRRSLRVVRRRDLRPGHGVPRQAKQRGAGSARNHRFKLAVGNPAASDESPAAPADQNGRRPQKGRRSRQTAGNPAVCVDPQPPRLTKTGCAHEALQTFH